MNWPAARFERFYEAYQKRLIILELTQRKLMMINALYANSNYDGENAKVRDQVIERLEDQFTQSVLSLYKQSTEEKEDLSENPFFNAMERGLKRQGVPSLDEMKGIEVDRPMMPDIEIDQIG